jgi:hypothetical protein
MIRIFSIVRKCSGKGKAIYFKNIDLDGGKYIFAVEIARRDSRLVDWWDGRLVRKLKAQRDSRLVDWWIGRLVKKLRAESSKE